jgi:helicase SWR1
MSDSPNAPGHHNHDASSIAPQESATHINGIKYEEVEELSLTNGTTNRHVGDHGEKKRIARDEDDADTANKRRKVSSMPRSGLSSRAVSPPWRFGSVAKATLIVNGKRRSARATATSSPVVQPVPDGKRPRRESATTNKPSYAALHNGTAGEAKASKQVTSHKRVRSSEKNASSSTFKKPGKPGKPVKRQEPSSPKTPKHVRSSNNTTASVDKTIPSLPARADIKRTSRRSCSLRDHARSDVAAPTADASPGRFQRLKLRLRVPKLGRSHPAHWPQQKKFGTFQEWLDSDNALEGETDVPLQDDELQKEIQARLRIVRATEPGGLLTEGRCTRFLERDAKEPPPRYGLWDHLCVHAINFQNLLGKEKERHKRMAKQLAASCQIALATEPRWAKVREQKSTEDLQREEMGYQVRRYKQVVKDMAVAWELARNEVNKMRFEQWEREQDALGRKALDDMLDQSTQLLYQHRMRDSTEDPSEARSSIGPTGSETGTGIDNSGRDDDSESGAESSGDSENMSESSEEDEEMVNAQDDDANLSPEALRRKYAAALEQDLPDASDSEGEEASEDDDDGSGSGTEEEDTAESEEEDEDEGDDEPSLLSLVLPKTGGLKPQPPDKSAEVDSKMDSTGTADDTISVIGGEQPPVELEEVDDALMDHSSDESTDMDEEDSDGSGNDIESSEADSEESDDEETGLMGFFAKPKKKLKVDDLLNDKHQDDTQMVNDDDEQVEEVEELSLDADTSMDIVEHDASRPNTPHTQMEPSKTEVPSLLLRGSLREYQHDGLDWLAKLYSGSRNGILADEMGLGKTIQTISLLAHLAVNHKIWGPHLVVVPTSVMLNWEMEFKKWLPGFKILTYYGDIEERRRKRQGWLNDDKWNVVIASYQLILKDAQAFKKRNWHYLILDEAHYIKNFQSQKWQTLLTFKTHSRLLLTGTPLQNDLQELWSLLYFLMPAGLDGSGGFADLEKFLNSMKRPADQILNQGQQKLDAEAQARVSKLHEVLRPFLLRRLKSEVEKQMPGKYEHVVYCRLSKRQRQLYDEFMSRSDTKRTLSSGNYMSIMNCLMSLRKVCNHPDLFETRQIVTSYAMPKSAVADYEIKELFVRRRLLREGDSVDLEHLGFVPTVFEKHSRLSQFRRYHLRAVEPLQSLVERQSKRLKLATDIGYATMKDNLQHIEADAEQSVLDSLKNCLLHSRRTTDQWPIYGTDFVALMKLPNRFFPPPPKGTGLQMRDTGEWATEENCRLVQDLMPSLDEVAARCKPIISKFACLTPAVVAEDVKEYALTPIGMQLVREAQALTPSTDPYHEARIRASIAFPDKRLLQYDCGKLQALANLLRDLQSGGHRCLIFTQMTKVLDILEQFLNIHGHRYLRLDGATKIEQRQILTDRFNNDPRILVFILSSRSGGLGINLTGADTVIFYDLDWNPAMDAQCQDRCHRIGQTRDVHIYRFVSEHTIEANILRKSNQKRLLDDVIIQKGEFTTQGFNRSVTYKDAFADTEELEGEDAEASAAMDRVLGEVTGLGTVLDSVEDKEDAVAAKEAQKEAIYNADDADFNDSSNQASGATPNTRDATQAVVDEVAQAARDMAADEKGPVDEWMVKYLDTYELRGLPVILPKAVINAKKNAARKGRDYRRKR